MTKDFPQELLSPLDRPTDPKSVDARMAGQIAFESMGRTAPKEFDLPDTDSERKKRIQVRAEHLAKRAATIVALGAVVGGFMLAVGRAYDYEQHVHQPPVATDTNSAKP